LISVVKIWLLGAETS